jgi:hypothetical protein
MNAVYMSELVRYASDKLDGFKKLKELTEKQRLAIDSEDMDGLGLLVELKWQVINGINRCDRLIEQKLERLKQDLGITGLAELCDIMHGSDGAGELCDIVDGIKSQMDAITRMEQQNNKILLRLSEKAKADIRKIRDGKRYVKGYGGIMNRPYGSFIDSKK